MSISLLVVTLAVLLGVQPLATDLYTPSLPSLPPALGTTVAHAQLTLSVMTLSFGCFQLLAGPWADRLGRRPVLLVGLLAFVLGSAGATFAPSIWALIAARALQGLGVAACVVCARAMVRDLFEPQQGARVLAAAFMGLAAVPLLGPPLGGWLETQWGWRSAFAAMTLYGAAALVLVYATITETAPSLNPQATQVAPMLRNWAQVSRSSVFWTHTAITSSTYAGLFAYISGSSFVLIGVMGLSRQTFGFAFSSMVLGYLLGAALCKRLLRTHSIVQTLRYGVAFSILAVLIYLATWRTGFPHWLWVCIAQFAYMMGHGIYNPCSQAAMVAPFPKTTGAAAALGGFVNMLVAFGVGAWMGASFNQTAVPLALTIATFSLLTALLALLAAPRWGRV